MNTMILKLQVFIQCFASYFQAFFWFLAGFRLNSRDSCSLRIVLTAWCFWLPFHTIHIQQNFLACLLKVLVPLTSFPVITPIVFSLFLALLVFASFINPFVSSPALCKPILFFLLHYYIFQQFASLISSFSEPFGFSFLSWISSWFTFSVLHIFFVYYLASICFCKCFLIYEQHFANNF